MTARSAAWPCKTCRLVPFHPQPGRDPRLTGNGHGPGAGAATRRSSASVAVGASIAELRAMYPSEIAEPSPRHQTSLIDARARQCRFIVSDGTREAICCGAPTSETSSWCAWHRQIVYTPRLAERDRRRAA
ncbi:MAG TPA: GcrA family cell cycle regulator [Microvirga sp.]|nr:GcrA family cell cycle regulator [Microvirga sp.]